MLCISPLSLSLFLGASFSVRAGLYTLPALRLFNDHLHWILFSSAFNAIISASVVALGVSYGIPIAIHCLRGRNKLPPRPFVLPSILGWIANLVGLAYVIVTTVLFLFPPELPVTGSNMSKQALALNVS